MSDDPFEDAAPVALKPEDAPIRLRSAAPPRSPPDSGTASPRGPSPVAPRRARSQLAALDSHLLALQEDVESLFGVIRDPRIRRLVRAVYGGLEEAHARVARLAEAVARGD